MAPCSKPYVLWLSTPSRCRLPVIAHLGRCCVLANRNNLPLLETALPLGSKLANERALTNMRFCYTKSCACNMDGRSESFAVILISENDYLLAESYSQHEARGVAAMGTREKGDEYYVLSIGTFPPNCVTSRCYDCVYELYKRDGNS